MDNYQAYESLSQAYRKHLGINDGRTVVWQDEILERLSEIKAGAPKRDSSELKKNLESVRNVKLPLGGTFGNSPWFNACEQLARAESE